MIYYDFHIHSALSPCASNDMTPNNIINMAMICGLDAIAVTDHNSCKNLKAIIAASKNIENSPLIIPGMELETQEEIHLLCLFPNILKALDFEEIVYKNRFGLKNRPEIFGQQLIMNENDEIVSEYSEMLLSATKLGIYEAVKLVKRIGGVAIPAHIDRNSYSILTSLGFLPDDAGINMVEYSKRCDPSEFYRDNKALFSRRYPYLRNSDAHLLEDISERDNILDVSKNSTSEEIIDYLLNL